MKEPLDLEALIAAAYVGGAISLIAYIIRVVISDNHGSMKKFLAGLAEAVFVGVVAMWSLEGFGLMSGVKGAIVASMAFTAPDVLRAIRLVAAGIGADPVVWIRKVRRALAGKEDA